ncbi:MAG: hypothetical protein QXT68_00885 [Halobacteria archaeon]
MAEDYDEALRSNLRRLSSIGTTIEEVRDRPFKRLQALEVAVVRLSEQIRTSVGREEMARLREELGDLSRRLDVVERAQRDAGPAAKIERELRSSLAGLEERVKGLDRSLRDSVKKLSQIDAEIINELAKFQDLVGEPETLIPPEPPPRKALAPEAPAAPKPRPAAPARSEGRGRKEELEKERERLLAQLGRATEEHGSGQLSTEEYEELLRKGEERLAQIDEELERG